jgi:hypothetical protein
MCSTPPFDPTGLKQAAVGQPAGSEICKHAEEGRRSAGKSW